MPLGVTAKDMILALIGHVGAAGGTGHAVEYAGSAIRELPIEGRLTICNLSIELGAKTGMVAPDQKTFEYLSGRSYAPQGEMWEQAVKAWRELPSDADAVFDKEVVIDVTKIIPQVTWGISPEHVIGVDGRIPDPQAIDDPARRAAIETALDYMGLKPGALIAGTPVDWVFIGSCTNSRLSDLRAAAEVARGRRWRRACGPGSCRVRKRSSATRSPRGSTSSLPRRASSGASPAVRCASPPTGKRLAPASARSRPPIAILLAGKGRGRERISPVRPAPPPRRSPAPSPACA